MNRTRIIIFSSLISLVCSIAWVTYQQTFKVVSQEFYSPNADLLNFKEMFLPYWKSALSEANRNSNDQELGFARRRTDFFVVSCISKSAESCSRTIQDIRGQLNSFMLKNELTSQGRASSKLEFLKQLLLTESASVSAGLGGDSGAQMSFDKLADHNLITTLNDHRADAIVRFFQFDRSRNCDPNYENCKSDKFDRERLVELIARSDAMYEPALSRLSHSSNKSLPALIKWNFNRLAVDKISKSQQVLEKLNLSEIKPVDEISVSTKMPFVKAIIFVLLVFGVSIWFTLVGSSTIRKYSEQVTK